jgi:hypothetical protein
MNRDHLDHNEQAIRDVAIAEILQPTHALTRQYLASLLVCLLLSLHNNGMVSETIRRLLHASRKKKEYLSLLLPNDEV